VSHDTLTALVRDAIASDGRSIRQIAIAAGLEPMTVGRFASGQRDLTSERLGRLMGVLGLRVTSPARAVPPIAPAAAGRRR
jgi:transcriptional regulator with XRE-family HTH domain